MIDILVEKLLYEFKRNGLVQKSEIDLYAFGLNRLILFLLNISTTIIIGICFSMIWQIIIFSIAYIMIRRYAGGYHASCSKSCFYKSVVLVIFALILISIFSHSFIFLLIVITYSTIIIILKAPVESKEKRLTDIERAIFRKKAIIITFIESFTALALGYIFLEVAICIAIAIFFSAIMLVFKR